MTKKYYGLQVHTLTFLKVDENGESIDGKQYEYTGDHSGFCDGIEDEYLEEIRDPYMHLMETGEKQK
jgi:hypothetical protein